MKRQYSFTLIFLFTIILFVKESNAQKFLLLKKSTSVPGTINRSAINKLNEPLKAIAAYYSGLGGSNCSGDSCQLTTALGLGKQGSEEHKAIITKWFGEDKAAKQLLDQNCYQPPNTASSFSDFAYLTFEKKGTKVYVTYKLLNYSQGSSTYISGAPDVYNIGKEKITVIKRNIWKNIK